jgi:hypothetical protein
MRSKLFRREEKIHLILSHQAEEGAAGIFLLTYPASPPKSSPNTSSPQVRETTDLQKWQAPERCVLPTGGLDTSCILKWLLEQ